VGSCGILAGNDYLPMATELSIPGAEEEQLQAPANPSVPNPGESAVHFVVDPRTSRFKVQAFAAGLLSAFGHNPVIAIRDFEGEIRYHPQHVDESRLSLRIDPHKLEVASEVSDKDRREIEQAMYQDVLEVDRYPEIRYECSRLSATATGEGQYSIVLNGDLTLHGVTRSQSVSARVYVNGNLLRASGESTVRQTDYSIRLVSVGGVLRVKDELKLAFDIMARHS
jgi:polyisoprenoid-binding protein YceI